MRKATVILVTAMLCGVGIPAQGEFMAEYDVPQWSGTTDGSSAGNPYTDTGGNTWGAYSFARSGSSSKTVWSNYTKMVWDDANTYWEGASNDGGHPRFDVDSDTLPLTSRRHDGHGTNYVGVLAFSPGVAGTYSWYGTITAKDWSGQGHNTYLTFGKFDGSGNWTQLEYFSIPHNSTKDLGGSDLAGLHDIALAADDTLVVDVRSYYNYDIAAVYFADDADDPVGIGKIPEPTTMLLLAGGAMGIVLRRKRI